MFDVASVGVDVKGWFRSTSLHSNKSRDTVAKLKKELLKFALKKKLRFFFLRETVTFLTYILTVDRNFTYILTAFLRLTVILHENTVKTRKNKPFTEKLP